MTTNTVPQNEINVCTCGRSYTHCRRCGKRNPYVKKLRSLDLSIELGDKVTVYRCQRCSAETHTGMVCSAPMLEISDGSEYVPFSKPKAAPVMPLWGHAVPGSIEHQVMLNDWITEHQHKGWSATQVYVEAQKAGWHLEYFGDRLDADVKQALVDRGLWIEQAPQQEAGQGSDKGGVMASPGAPQEPPVSLDEIIKNMQENSK